jgi:hypothetical protein
MRAALPSRRPAHRPPGQRRHALVHLPRLLLRGAHVGAGGKLLQVVQHQQQEVEAQGAHALPRQRAAAVAQVAQALGEPALLGPAPPPPLQPSAKQLLLPAGARSAARPCR